MTHVRLLGAPALAARPIFSPERRRFLSASNSALTLLGIACMCMDFAVMLLSARDTPEAAYVAATCIACFTTIAYLAQVVNTVVQCVVIARVASSTSIAAVGDIASAAAVGQLTLATFVAWFTFAWLYTMDGADAHPPIAIMMHPLVFLLAQAVIATRLSEIWRCNPTMLVPS